jgi:hypothetical protein
MELHERVETTDLYWINNEMWWRIHLIGENIVEVSDENLRKWLKDAGEKTGQYSKISYRKMARYALANVCVEQLQQAAMARSDTQKKKELRNKNGS